MMLYNNLPSIDLHGEDREYARITINDFIRDQYQMKNDKVLITYNFSGTDSSGDDVSEGNYSWKIGSKIIASGIATNGENTFDATDFATTTSQKFVLTITDDSGSLATKSWTVQKVDVRLESTFRDSEAYIGDVSFNYIPYGAIEKEIHFVLDGEELDTVTTSNVLYSPISNIWCSFIRCIYDCNN